MSFGDVSPYPAGNRNMGEVNSAETLAPIKLKLTQFQRMCSTIKDAITDMRRRKITQSEKTQLDQQIRDLRKADTDLKLLIDQKLRVVDSDNLLKAALLKLQKDFEKTRINVDSLAKESLLVRVDTGSSAGATGGSAGGNRAGFGPSVGRLGGDSYGNVSGPSDDDGSGGRVQKQQMILRPVMQEHDIDQMLIEERERDILKINKDLAMVHDMFVRMADIVEDQGVKIDQIHVATEVSHERAEAGLEQVKQAATYQPTCIIS